MHQFDNGTRATNRSDMTMEAIKRYILENGLNPGDPLPSEAELCAYLGVSRSSVREAMRKLDALDIVHSKRGSGTYVGDMSLNPLVSTLVLKSALDAGEGFTSLAEVVAVRKALDLGVGLDLITAMRGTDNPFLRSLIGQMRVLATRGETYYDQDIAFHTTLLSVLNNQILVQLTSAMWLIHQAVTPNLHPADREAMALTAHAHAKILDACEKGNLEDYYRAVKLHYEPLEGILAQER